MNSATRKFFKLSGRIQGIGFRGFARDTALELGVTGWICNIPGEQVEGEVQGDPAKVEQFLRELKSGYPLASVRELVDTSLPPTENETDFRIKFKL